MQKTETELKSESQSGRLYERAAKFITGGVHSNYRFVEPHPHYFSRAKGSRVHDIDGNEFVDCICNMGACVLGHGNPEVIRAVRKQLSTGLTVGLETETSVEAAKLLTKMVPSAEVVKFSNTGTEANMHAIHIARGYTGKHKIAKLEGGFNGWYDYALVSTHPELGEAGSPNNPRAVAGANGLARDVTRETVILPFNNTADSVRIINQNKDELAAVVLEPVMFNVGCVLPDVEYLKAMREVTETHGIPLIFDEVISGFRMAPGGAQEFYHITPDISTFAKAIANGFPFAAVTGKHEFMDITTPNKGGEFLSMKRSVSFFGTYNANQMSLAACYACLKILKTGSVQKKLHASSDWLLKEFWEVSKDLGGEAVLSSIAGKFQVYFTPEVPTEYRSASKTNAKKYAAFYNEMIASEILMHPSPTAHHGVSAAHTRDDLALIIRAMEKALRKAKLAAG